ncbi:MAG: hypothetical protein R3C32_06085 [Chloroflexota bacterium]
MFDGHGVVGITGGTSTPIEDLGDGRGARARARRRPRHPGAGGHARGGGHRGGRRSRVSEHSIGRADRRPVPASRRSPVATAQG